MCAFCVHLPKGRQGQASTRPISREGTHRKCIYPRPLPRWVSSFPLQTTNAHARAPHLPSTHTKLLLTSRGWVGTKDIHTRWGQGGMSFSLQNGCRRSIGHHPKQNNPKREKRREKQRPHILPRTQKQRGSVCVTRGWGQAPKGVGRGMRT